MSIKKNLTAITLALSLTLNACAAGNAEQKPKQPEYVQATVLDELEIPGYNFQYAIKFKTENNKTYFAHIVEHSSTRDLVAIDLAIQKGTKIKVRRSALENKEGYQFSSDNIGVLDTKDIYLEDSN
jgi:hypothetical protein